MPVWPPFLDEKAQLVVTRVLMSFDQGLWIATILGMGFHYLNRQDRLPSCMNDAILPSYILYQSLNVVMVFWLP